jgi:hypothetical protein
MGFELRGQRPQPADHFARIVEPTHLTITGGEPAVGRGPRRGLLYRHGHQSRSLIEAAVQRRLNEHPEKMRQRRETVEHPFGAIKARMGATHFLAKTLPRVATEMALHVLTYNLTRVINIMGPGPLIAAIKT